MGSLLKTIDFHQKIPILHRANDNLLQENVAIFCNFLQTCKATLRAARTHSLLHCFATIVVSIVISKQS